MKKRKYEKTEMSRRISELNKQYTQKQLAKKFGVSTSTIGRWKAGKGTPKSEKVYKNINRTYNKTIPYDRKEEIKKQAKAKKLNTKQEVSIYPEYIHTLSKTFEIGNIETLINLSEAGYVASYIGQADDIPLEVEFIIHGESLTRWGKTMFLVGVVSGNGYPKDGDYKEGKQYIRIYKCPQKLVKYSIRVKKEDDFFTRNEINREYFKTYINQVNNYKYNPIAYLGYFFLEGDEV